MDSTRTRRQVECPVGDELEVSIACRNSGGDVAYKKKYFIKIPLLGDFLCLYSVIYSKI